MAKEEPVHQRCVPDKNGTTHDTLIHGALQWPGGERIQIDITARSLRAEGTAGDAAALPGAAAVTGEWPHDSQDIVIYVTSPKYQDAVGDVNGFVKIPIHKVRTFGRARVDTDL